MPKLKRLSAVYLPLVITRLLAAGLLLSLQVTAGEIQLAQKTLPEAAASNEGMSTQQRLHDMDKDHDGMVSVYEVRSFIEARHGKHYQQQALNEMESSASGKSCSTPFANSLY